MFSVALLLSLCITGSSAVEQQLSALKCTERQHCSLENANVTHLNTGIFSAHPRLLVSTISEYSLFHHKHYYKNVLTYACPQSVLICKQHSGQLFID